MRRKPRRFDTLEEYNAYIQGVKNGFILGILMTMTVGLTIDVVLRWLKIW